MEKKIKIIHPAVAAVWAAVVAAGHLLPTIPILGTGSVFSLSSAFFPLTGILFGPVTGALCAAIGGFIGNLAAPHTALMGPFSFIIGTTTAFTTGCVAWGKWPPVKIDLQGSFIFNGAIIVYFIGTILWFTQEIGRSVARLPVVYYGLGLFAMIAGIILSSKLFSSPNKMLRFPAIWLCAFSGLIGGATIGNFFSLLLYKLPREVWLVLTVQSPVERAVFAAIAMAIGVPLLEGLNKLGISVGPQKNEELIMRD